MRLSYAMPYYRNPGMLAEQYRVWSGYPAALKGAIEIVLVDDGSPAEEAAAAIARPDGLPALRIYQVLEDRPWHQHGARNLAAREADGDWLFLTDMDHVLPAASLAALVARLDQDIVYTFARLDAPDLTPKLKDGLPHPHCNTFAMRRDRFWAIGGYDEDALGYGTDGYFRRRLLEGSRVVHLDDVPIIRYSRDVIADASTRADRNAGRRTAATRLRLAAKRQRHEGPKVLDFPWERVL